MTDSHIDTVIDTVTATDRVTQAYLDRCLDGDRGLLEAIGKARFGEKFLAANGPHLLSRPLFLDEGILSRFNADLDVFFDLLTSLPQRVFDGDMAAYCAALGMEKQRAAILAQYPGKPTKYGRVDAYHDGESLRLLEFNIGSALGGIDRAVIGPALLEVPEIAEFAAEHKLVHVHTGQMVADIYREAARNLTGGDDPVIGFVESASGFGDYVPAAKSFVEMMAGQGLEVVMGTITEITERDGRLYLHGKRIDLIQRHYTENEMVTEPGVAQAAERIFRAHDEGRVVQWTSLQSSLYHNKAALYLMSDSRLRKVFTTDEAALIDRVLPWSRLLANTETEVNGQTVELIDYCRAHRADLIIKQQRSFHSKGIVPGWDTDDADWAAALEEGIKEGSLVQRRVIRRAEQVVRPDTGAVDEYAATWGIFVTPHGYAGTSMRAMPIDDEIARYKPTLRSAAIFHFPAEQS
jgi:hypothetical protein